MSALIFAVESGATEEAALAFLHSSPSMQGRELVNDALEAIISNIYPVIDSEFSSTRVLIIPACQRLANKFE